MGSSLSSHSTPASSSSSSASSSHSTHTSSSRSCNYDVFLSFRGEDTRKTFVDHLYSALVERHIRTFRDDETLPRGESIGPYLSKAIEESYIAVIIFSENYADSPWCLEEVSHIMKCKDERQLIVMPVFYDVDPSEVRKLKRKFGEAFDKHQIEISTKVESWRKALVDASEITGWDPRDIGSGHESIVIKRIVDTVLDRLLSSNSDIDADLVGMTTRLQDMKTRLEFASCGVRMVGICGVGGSGKTTLGTSLCTEISQQFDVHYIVENIREESRTYGLKKLQENLLSTILKRKVEVQSVVEGKSKLKRMRVAGLPLALKVLGSFLYDKDEKEWTSTLARLKVIPEMEVVEKLKLSYDGLKTVEKELFLDIACFFRWESTNDAMEIFEACGYYPGIGIIVLRQIALITIVDGKFDMHDLVQEMGHYIVRGEHPNNPEKHNRVWKPAEISDMCFGDTTMENDKTEAIKYYARDHDEGSRLSKIVSNMKKLRWLSLSTYRDEHVEGPNFLSNALQYIYWQWYPASPFPDNFYPMKLVVLRLNYSFQKELWNGCKRLPHLKVLELQFMKLISTPDFGGLPCLQRLTLLACHELQEIHPSLGNHKSLEYVKVSRCLKLRMFPTIVQMEKLETLEIEICDAILEFLEIQANMESLVKLSLGRNGIGVLPSTIGVHCTYLVSLYLVDCFALKSIEFNFHALKHLKELKFGTYTRHKKMSLLLFEQVFTLLIPNLQKLDLGGCLLKDGEISSNISELSNLQELHLDRNDFRLLDFSLLQLTQLKLLNMSGCKQLVELPKLPSSIVILKADNCERLQAIGDFYINCKWLCHVSLIGGSIINDGSRLLESILQGNAIENHSMFLQLEGLEIAKGFTPPLRSGSRCTLELPDNWCNEFCGFLMCIVVTGDFNLSSLSISMKRMMSGTDSKDDVVWEENYNDKTTLVWYVSVGSLRHVAWRDETYKAALLSVEILTLCSGFGGRLVARKNGSGLTTTSSTEESEISDYTPSLKIVHDSANAIEISFNPNSNRNINTF